MCGSLADLAKDYAAAINRGDETRESVLDHERDHYGERSAREMASLLDNELPEATSTAPTPEQVIKNIDRQPEKVAIAS